MSSTPGGSLLPVPPDVNRPDQEAYPVQFPIDEVPAMTLTYIVLEVYKPGWSELFMNVALQ